MTFNDGGAYVAMVGSKCFTVGADHMYMQGDFFICEYKNKVTELSAHLYMMCPGLYADAQQFSEKMVLRKHQYERDNGRPMPPNTFASVASWELYSRKLSSPFYINPMIVGFYPNSHEVFLSTLDMMGCETRRKDFITGGTAQHQMMGLGMTFWRPEMEPEDLFEVTAKVIGDACQKDPKAGCGATVYIVEPEKVTVKEIAI